MAAMLTCKQCGHENETERIYCHNCGGKLDRSLLPTPGKADETTEKKRKRVMKMTTPTRGFFAGWYKTLIGTLITAVVVASLVQAVRPPDGIPAMPKKGELEDITPLNRVMEEKLGGPAPERFGINEDLANRYLRQTLRGHTEGALGDNLKFDRAFVHFTHGTCGITTQQSLFGYPLYATTLYQLKIGGTKLAATNVGGFVGRLPVHPKIMEQVDVLFRKLWEALEREHKLLDQMRAIEVGDGKITMETKGALPVRR